MNSKKVKIMISRIVTIMLWVFALYLLIVNRSWVLATVILALHCAELCITAYQRGRKANYPGWYTVMMTLIFGYTWWLYLKECPSQQAGQI